MQQNDNFSPTAQVESATELLALSEVIIQNAGSHQQLLEQQQRNGGETAGSAAAKLLTPQPITAVTQVSGVRRRPFLALPLCHSANGCHCAFACLCVRRCSAMERENTALSFLSALLLPKLPKADAFACAAAEHCTLPLLRFRCHCCQMLIQMLMRLRAALQAEQRALWSPERAAAEDALLVADGMLSVQVVPLTGETGPIEVSASQSMR